MARRAVGVAALLCEAVAADSDSAPATKSDHTPVTVADFAAQAVVCRALAEAFPDDPVIAEETPRSLREGTTAGLLPHVLRHVRTQVPGATEDEVLGWIGRGTETRGAERYWTLDPIDGTKGYIRGAQYVVALALIEHGRPVLACLAAPRLNLNGQVGVMASAVRGGGTSLVPLNGSGTVARLAVRASADGEVRFCESLERAHSSGGTASRVAGRIGESATPVRMDSQAKYALVAHGDADFYLRVPRGNRRIEYIWDHAAGHLLVEEAGGRVTDMDGSELDYSSGARLVSNRGIVASNGVLHDAILDALRQLASEPAGIGR